MRNRIVFIAFILSFSSLFVHSQDSWNAKILFHSQNGYVDTTWIGCDVSGDSGYQEGLDILDTSYLPRRGIWGFDPSIPVGTCFNLKKDVKDFVSGFQTFHFQIVDSLFDQQQTFDYITIDTNEFKFDNGNYKITSVYIECENGYLFGIDKFWEYIYIGFDPYFPPTFIFDSIPLIFEQDLLLDCLSVDAFQMQFKIEIAFNYYLGVPQLNLQNNKLSIYPNPGSGIVTINSKNLLKSVDVIDQMGLSIYSETLSTGIENFQLNTSHFCPGIYTVISELSGGSPNKIARKLIIF